MIAAVPRVALADLLTPSTCLAPAEYGTAAEKLAVGLGKAGVVVISLGPTRKAVKQRVLQDGLQALLASGVGELPGRVGRGWRVGGGAPASPAIEEVRAAGCWAGGPGRSAAAADSRRQAGSAACSVQASSSS